MSTIDCRDLTHPGVVLFAALDARPQRAVIKDHELEGYALLVREVPSDEVEGGDWRFFRNLPTLQEASAPEAWEEF